MVSDMTGPQSSQTVNWWCTNNKVIGSCKRCWKTINEWTMWYTFR